MMTCETKLYFLLLFSLPFSFQQSSRQMYGSAIQDYALVGYSFASFNTGDSFSCAHRCLSHDRCKSYNYNLSGAQQGLCELNSAERVNADLQYKPGVVFVQAILKKPAQSPTAKSPIAKYPSSCVDYWLDGVRISGIYRIEDSAGKSFDVHCELGTGTGGVVWTLVMSQSHANRAMPEFRSTSFYEDAPVNEDSPNWEAYRMSLKRITDLRANTTHWRATCSFPAHGVQYTDYVRAKFTEFDPLTFNGFGECREASYLNIRGYGCSGCTSAWWQSSSVLLHHNSSVDKCEFKSTPGFVIEEDNFGYYKHHNPSFRCSSSDNASTNHWFGSYVW